MNSHDISRLVALARADRRFVKGALGREFVQTFTSVTARRLARRIIAWKSGATDHRSDISTILKLAGY